MSELIFKVHHVRAKRAVASDKIGAHPSWALQPARSAPPPLPARHFQYPQSDRGRCNRLQHVSPACWQPAFSILSRIVGAATGQFQIVMNHVSGFQYPQSDRGRCNDFRIPAQDPHPPLSVSSVGSWALQHLHPPSPLQRTGSFQYPQSDRGRCNVAKEIVSWWLRVPFSILSRIVGAATKVSNVPCGIESFLWLWIYTPALACF